MLLRTKLFLLGFGLLAAATTCGLAYRRSACRMTGLFYCAADLMGCENDNLTELPSLGGGMKAMSFRRNCGATTSYSYQVHLASKSCWLAPCGIGNTFIAIESREATSPSAKPRLDLKWDGPNTLVILYPRQLQVLTAVRKVGGVNVRFEQK
jgi:hypothetical protein